MACNIMIIIANYYRKHNYYVKNMHVEPPNKGHFGSRHFIIIERLSFGGRLNNTKSIQMVPWRVSLMRGCPLVGGSLSEVPKRPLYKCIHVFEEP